MVQQFSYLAIIPARGGSMRIPDKNIIKVGGKPLIEWTIDAARDSRYVNRIIVSTDSISIAEISRKIGAEVPFLRPDVLAEDDTPGMLPILHSLEWVIENEGYQPDFIICLQPTSPLRTSKDIDHAIAFALENDADAIVSVSPVVEHPYWMKRLDGSGRITDFIQLVGKVNRRQELPPVYSLNGAIYLAKSKLLLEHRTWYTEGTLGFIMPVERSLDIDTPFDLKLAEFFLKGEIGI